MKKEYKILTLIVLGIFAISIIAGVVAAQDKISEGFLSLFQEWQEGQIGANVAKIFFFIIITLVITLALTSLFADWNQGLLILTSAMVSFLATAYITPAEVYSLLTSYTALGLTLATLVPIFIIGALTYKAAISGKAPLLLLQRLAWVLFAIYLIYKVIILLISGEGSTVVTIIVGVSTLAAIWMNFANRQMIKWIMKAELESLTEAGGKRTDEAAAAITMLSEHLRKIAK